MLQIKNPNYSLMTDIVFKIVFSNPLVPEIPLSFLNAVLNRDGDRQIKELEILNPFTPKELLTDKLSILDLKAKDGLGHIFHIEVQLKHFSFLAKRFLYYHYKLIASQLSQGETYSSLKPAVSIYILGSNHLDEPGFHNVITMMNRDSGRVYTGLSEIHFLELEKLEGNLNSPSTALEKWMQAFLHSDQYCLDTGSVPKEMDKEEVIMKALNLIKEANSDEETKHLIDLRHKSQLDFNSITDEARQEGLQEGLQEGIQLGEQRGEKRGFQLGAGQGLIEGKLKFCLELYQEGTMDSEAARSKMKRLLGSGFDNLVQEYLDKLP